MRQVVGVLVVVVLGCAAPMTRQKVARGPLSDSARLYLSMIEPSGTKRVRIGAQTCTEKKDIALCRFSQPDITGRYVVELETASDNATVAVACKTLSAGLDETGQGLFKNIDMELTYVSLEAPNRWACSFRLPELAMRTAKR